MDTQESRSETLVELFGRYVRKDESILEIGCGDDRNLRYLREAGYTNVKGIDKQHGTAIEDVPEEKFDVIFTMSTLFLIPEENEWVFEKIARMAKRLIVTFEGETSKDFNHVIGRNYTSVFRPFGFSEVEHITPIFNIYGHLRVLEKNA